MLATTSLSGGVDLQRQQPLQFRPRQLRPRGISRPGSLGAVATLSVEREAVTEAAPKQKVPKVVVAGGAIGGLAAAIALKNRGIDVTCYERVRKYKPFGGPLQMAGNALGTLEAIDSKLAAEIINNGTITGDRVNGLLDCQTGQWYVRFDTRKPAQNRGLPLTSVISRYDLLDLLVQRCQEISPDLLVQGVEVTGYKQTPDGTVLVNLSDGSTVECDILVGADGINSKIRQQVRGPGDKPIYSGYTCYTATCDYEAPDVQTVGYQVYLGTERYFVSSDVGAGRTQWYAFHKRPQGSPEEADMKGKLLEIFGDACPDLLARIHATRPEQIERRDISDLRPNLKWTDGSVCLLGDSAHAMQPNMGQGACQAIEDAYILSKILAETARSWDGHDRNALRWALLQYQFQRAPRAAAVQGFARAAALMATTYRPYLGSSPYEFYKAVPGMVDAFRELEKAKIRHPGRIVGQIAMMASIDLILDYLAGGCPVDEGERAPYCQLPGQGNVPLRPVTDEHFKMRGLPGFAG